MINWGKVILGQLMGREETIAGQRVLIPRGVFDPTLFRSGGWFGVQVAHRLEVGSRVLDLGCGTGFVGLLARCAGAHVISTDIDPRACKAARSNGVVDVRCGDLFEPVQGQHFDLVCFNPPFFPGHPWGRPYGRALYGGPQLEVVSRFVSEVGNHLTETGNALVVWSDRAPDAASVLGDKFAELMHQEISGERLSLWTRKTPGPG